MAFFRAGSDRLEGYKPGPWSVVLYDCLARISGRYCILCYNFLLITRLESLEYILTNSFVSKHLLNCSNIVNANTRLHSWTGIGLCVITLLHVWSILFPCIFHGYGAVVVVGNFEWPLSERPPVKCSEENVAGCWPGDANPETKTMGLEVDDVFRMVEMTIFLGILMPLSIKWLATRWHAAIHLHRIISLVYFVDIVRRHTHPHSWILNAPMFCLYVLDKFVWSNYWQRNASPEVKKVKLGQDFMVLYWKSPFGLTETVGPDYALLMNESSILEEKHVFTCFQNRSRSNLLLGDDADLFDWSVGTVIRVFRRPRTPRLGRRDAYSHTMRMFFEEPRMLITGPRQGEMSEKIRHSLLAKKNEPLILFGGGSAINFIIDALQWCSNNDSGRSHLFVVYTTRDFILFEWCKETLSNLLPLCEDNDIMINVKLAFTGMAPENAADKAAHWFTDVEKDTKFFGLETVVKRVNLYEEIFAGSTVFCQGSAGLKNAVGSVCREVDAHFDGGRGGS